MKITEETPTLLKLENSHLMLSWKRVQGVILGFIFFGAGLSTIALASSRTNLTCYRNNEENCEVKSSHLFGFLQGTNDEIPLNELEEATVESRTSRRSRRSGGSRRRRRTSTTYRVTLITNNDEIPLTNSYSSGQSSKERKVNEINQFINDSSQNSLHLTQGGNWLVSGFGSLFMLAGGGIGYATWKRKFQLQCLFDRDSGQMYLKKQNPSSSETESWAIEEIQEAEVVSKNSSKKKQYKAQLVLKSGESIKLDVFGSRSHKEKITQSINEFLG